MSISFPIVRTDYGIAFGHAFGRAMSLRAHSVVGAAAPAAAVSAAAAATRPRSCFGAVALSLQTNMSQSISKADERNQKLILFLLFLNSKLV